MATIASPSPEVAHRPTQGKGGDFDGSGSDSGWDDGPRRNDPSSDRRYYTGMYLGLGAVTMFFAAFTSAYIVRKGLSDDWQAMAMPAILWPNTLVLLASSLVLEKARRCLGDGSRFNRWWLTGSGLGLTFLVGQIWAWQQLVDRGVYVSTNPSSSFFYLLTGAHGVHLLGGVIALLYISWRVWNSKVAALEPTAVGVTALYWHFMDGLWIYLFLFLLIWR